MSSHGNFESGDLDLMFRMDLTASQAGQAFHFNVLGGTAAPVPIPAVGWLIGPVLGLLGWARRRVTQ